jgi:hypothetical protein
MKVSLPLPDGCFRVVETFSLLPLPTTAEAGLLV